MVALHNGRAVRVQAHADLQFREAIAHGLHRVVTRHGGCGIGLMLRFSACTAPAALAHREQNPVAVPGQHLAVLAQR